MDNVICGIASLLINIFSLPSATVAQFYKLTKHYCITQLQKYVSCVIINYSQQLSHYRQAAETAQTDLAAEKVVSSGLQHEVCVHAELLNSL